MTEEGGFCLGCLLLHEAEVLEESEELLSGGENMKDNHLAGTNSFHYGYIISINTSNSDSTDVIHYFRSDTTCTACSICCLDIILKKP